MAICLKCCLRKMHYMFFFVVVYVLLKKRASNHLSGLDNYQPRHCVLTLCSMFTALRKAQHDQRQKQFLTRRETFHHFWKHFCMLYHSGWLPELLCHSLMACRSPRENGVVSRNRSTAPLSNTHFFGSDRWCGSLFPSAPSRVIVTCNSSVGLCQNWVQKPKES